MDSSLRQTLVDSSLPKPNESSIRQTAQATESPTVAQKTTPTPASPLHPSPSGKRTALAPLDVNTRGSKRAIQDEGNQEKSCDDIKRLKTEPEVENQEKHGRGDQQLERQQEDDNSPARSRSSSPEVSSVFDTSVADASWATATTNDPEPEPAVTATTTTAAPTTAAAPRLLTREQAREKIEVLRLRLGLASYKVRTGQMSVPLAELQPRRLSDQSKR
ncbi:cyclin-dependent kinase [Ophiocordyceps camponoti-floridani]|uniref:Cyclin-dependent kinase n=1 Tax=Ophiocordyceps camponoti-floridani TaxID=2030778 RepID=A0A8H4Q0Q0_9HYPO|nr:cyclin-dependent kinase [Ophiocordyceps camponoti-floridani]